MNQPDSLNKRFDYLQSELQEADQSCTINKNEVDDRNELFEFIKNSSTNISQSQGKITISFPTDHKLAQKIVEFSLKERQCCNFFDFNLDFSNNLETFDFHISSESLTPSKFDNIISTMLDN